MNQEDYPDFRNAVERLQQFLSRNNWPESISWIRLIDFVETADSSEEEARRDYESAVRRKLGVALEARYMKNGISHVAITSPKDVEEQEQLMYPNGLKLSILEK